MVDFGLRAHRHEPAGPAHSFLRHASCRPRTPEPGSAFGSAETTKWSGATFRLPFGGHSPANRDRLCARRDQPQRNSPPRCRVARSALRLAEVAPAGRWRRADAMTNEDIHAAALADPADARPLTPERLKLMKRTPQVKVIRRAFGSVAGGIRGAVSYSARNLARLGTGAQGARRRRSRLPLR